jgi:nucleoside diphosphate kinase
MCRAISYDKEENVVTALRDFCGPYDPELARVINPNSLRAKYGLDKARNAVHCSDLKEDAALDVSKRRSLHLFSNVLGYPFPSFVATNF